tara:strand:- start:1486 stop:2121 length:636 start_codon:yes stop_codon:yes gene_type:complete
MKRILITGMPRSGTSFTHEIFYGACNKISLYRKMMFTEHKFFCLSEPLCFSTKGIRQDVEVATKMVEMIERYQSEYLLEEDGNRLFVMKCHPLIHSPTELFDLFDNVLICVRKPESWILSAQQHPAASEQMRLYAKRSGMPAERYGNFLYNCSIDLVQRLTDRYNGKDVVELLDFHEPEENLEKLKKVIRYATEENIERLFRENWRGSRFE